MANPVTAIQTLLAIKAHEAKANQSEEETPKATAHALLGSPKEVKAEEIFIKDSHNKNVFPSLLTIETEANGDEVNNNAGGPFHSQISLWNILGTVLVMLVLVFVIWKIRKCYLKRKAKKASKKAEKEAKIEAAEEARHSRYEALALTPMQVNDRITDLTGKFEKWNNDRFEQMSEKLEKMQKIVENPVTQQPAIAFGNNIDPPPASPPRKNRGRHH